MKREIRTSGASVGDGPYSQGVIAGNFVFVSGQGPLDPQSGEVVGVTIEEQADLTLRNVQQILTAAGCGMDDVVRVTVFLADLREFARFNAVYARFFGKPYPSRTCVEAGLDGIRVEIDAIAMLP